MVMADEAEQETEAATSDLSFAGWDCIAPFYAPFRLAQQAVDYWIDACQRQILFTDVLKQRSNSHLVHEHDKESTVLHFKTEMILDGRKMRPPVNYQLCRIIPPHDAIVDPQKRPFIIFDPRAGHEPGIGGMKEDSEVGSTLRAGHPCYFVGFSPEPVPGQTVEHVYEAEAVFVAKVIEMHPRAEKPCLIGNCQAGWQITMMGAIYPELIGVLILAGSPMSYWAGVRGKNPMRYKGGLLGGSWATAFANDLGNGKFDGALLVQNFEGMNLANTYWKKAYSLYSKVDTEAQRFLEFERWWGSPILLNGEEIQFIVDALFIGNRLSTAKLSTSDGLRIDIRNIKAPIVIFCSQADDITPPQQALDWILDLYRTDDEIVASGQTIIYCMHRSAGHLGIFVSSSVASKEHDKFIQNIGLIEALPAGLHEAVFIEKTNETKNADLASGQHIIRFERRTLNDIRAIGCNDLEDERRFASVARLSGILRELYETFVSPTVSLLVTEDIAAAIRQANPIRMRYAMFSDRNPWLQNVSSLAEMVRQNRHTVSNNNVFLRLQNITSNQIVIALDAVREIRDRTAESMFISFYGSPLLQAVVGLNTSHRYTKHIVGRDVDRERDIQRRLAGVSQLMEVGGLREATVRGIMYVLRGTNSIDERGYRTALKVLNNYPALSVTPTEYKNLIHSQSVFLSIDEKGALETLSSLLDNATSEDIATALSAIKEIIQARGDISSNAMERITHLLEYFVASHASLYRRTLDVTVFEELPETPAS